MFKIWDRARKIGMDTETDYWEVKCWLEKLLIPWTDRRTRA